MPLTRVGFPNLPTRSAPIDALMTFKMDGVPMTASGWASGSPTNYITLGPGRVHGVLMLQVHAADISSGNEAYQFFLHGSNDAAFGAGNCELLGAFDIAASPNQRLAQPTTQDTGWPGIASGTSAAIYPIPISNDKDVFTLSFANLYVTMLGTTPSITFDAWFAPFTGHKV
jgi:hypothetical protein